MKVIIKYFMPLCLLICITGCDDNNSVHQKYLDLGETFYTGKVEAVIDSAGNEKVKFTWILNSDPRIDRCVFYWNEGKDSAVIFIDGTRSGYSIMDTTLNVKEGIYIFSLITKDDEGHKSMATERTVQVYGPVYISRLTNRNMSASFGNGRLTVKWIRVEDPLIRYCTVRYTDYSDPAHPVPASVTVDNADTETVIEGVREGDTFSISTSHLPEGGLEILEALPVEYTVR